MGSGTQRVITGSVEGTGAQLDVLAVIGFRPRKVTIQNRTSRIMLDWQEGQPDASANKTLAAGTRTFVTSNGITPLAKGFRLGTDSINGSGEVLDFVVEE